jgi:hypothetical protein
MYEHTQLLIAQHAHQALEQAKDAQEKMFSVELANKNVVYDLRDASIQLEYVIKNLLEILAHVDPEI